MADIKYSKALEKLEDILSKIDNEEIDIDELSEKVREAASLVKVCKDKILKAEMEVKDVVESFNKE